MITPFNSYPLVSFKQISDADTVTVFKDKVQFNFDQIYLNFVNKVLKGEKGDIGYTGLSIKGDKGDKGDKGSKTYFDTVVNNQPVTDPSQYVDDVVITPTGSYFLIVDDGFGNLTYSFQFVLPTSGLFISEFGFFQLGAVTTHQLFDATSNSNILLAEKQGVIAKYKKMTLGNNVTSSSTVDTLTLVNILDSGTDVTSTPTKQMSLRYRDSNVGAVSLTSFDIAYSIASNIEYKVMGDSITNIAMIKDNNVGNTKAVINTIELYFTGGISNYQLADDSNSIVFRKGVGSWKMLCPQTDTMSIGYGSQMTFLDDKVGINTLSPSRKIDFNGNFLIGEPDPMNVGFYLAYTKSDANHFEYGYKNQYVRLALNQWISYLSGTQYIQLTSTSAIIKSGNQQLSLSTTATTLQHSTTTLLSMSSSLATLNFQSLYSLSFSSSAAFLGSPSNYMVITPASILFRHTHLLSIKEMYLNQNGLNVAIIKGVTDDLVLKPFSASVGVVKLKDKVNIVNQAFSQSTTTVSSGVQYITDILTGSISAVSTGIGIVDYDRILYIDQDNGQIQVSLDNGAWVEIFNGSGDTYYTIIQPAGVDLRIRITYTGTVATAKITAMKFGV